MPPLRVWCGKSRRSWDSHQELCRRCPSDRRAERGRLARGDDVVSKRLAAPGTRVPAFPVYPGDLMREPCFAAMTPEARGALFMLMLFAWSGSPPGHLSNDDEELASLSGLNDRWKVCKRSVLKMFEQAGEKLRLPWMADYWAKLESERQAQSAAGKRGAKERWGNRQVPIDSNGHPNGVPMKSTTGVDGDPGLSDGSSIFDLRSSVSSSPSTPASDAHAGETAAPSDLPRVVARGVKRDKAAQELLDHNNDVHERILRCRPYKTQEWLLKIVAALGRYSADELRSVIDAAGDEVADDSSGTKTYLLGPAYWTKSENVEIMLGRVGQSAKPRKARAGARMPVKD